MSVQSSLPPPRNSLSTGQMGESRYPLSQTGVGLRDGAALVGLIEGASDEGLELGEAVVGEKVGGAVGVPEGIAVGDRLVGEREGPWLGEAEGVVLGAWVVGDPEGAMLGLVVGSVAHTPQVRGQISFWVRSQFDGSLIAKQNVMSSFS